MGRLFEGVTVKCELAAVQILNMHLRLTRLAETRRRWLPCQPGIPQAGAESHTVATPQVTENSLKSLCGLRLNVQLRTGPKGARRMVHGSHGPHWGFINGTGRELEHKDKHTQLITPWLSCTFHTGPQSVWSCVCAVFREEWEGKHYKLSS